MEKLAGFGLVQIQPTRPKMFAALPSEVVIARVSTLRGAIGAVRRTGVGAAGDVYGPAVSVRGRHPFVDLALGVEGHTRRHLVPSRRPGSAFCRTWKPAT